MPSLSDVADDMIRQARRRGVAQRDLSRGLSIELVTVGGLNTLTLKRETIMPGDDEIAVCLEAFHVPAGLKARLGDTEVTYRWPSSSA